MANCATACLLIGALCVYVASVNRQEKITFGLTVCGITIGILAWVFPKQSAVVHFVGLEKILPQPSRTEIPETDLINLIGDPGLPAGQPIDLRPRKEQLLSELSFNQLYSQVVLFSSDSQKLRYIENNKIRVVNQISFTELNSLLDEFSLGSNKLNVVSNLRRSLSSPSGIELERYLLHFSLDSLKQRALALLN